ncbi:hypothetical protein TNCV_2125881 [Trichonephila clavipes]|nr:hypothetical protein TNCV_2125881 [Trichonephila clavipes]
MPCGTPGLHGIQFEDHCVLKELFRRCVRKKPITADGIVVRFPPKVAENELSVIVCPIMVHVLSGLHSGVLNLSLLRTKVFVKAVTPKCLGSPPVDRDRLYTHPRSKMSIDRKNKGIEGIRPRNIEKLIDIGAMEKEVTDIYNEKKNIGKTGQVFLELLLPLST